MSWPSDATAIDKLISNLQAQIADAEKEAQQLQGKVETLHSVLSLARTFKEQRPAIPSRGT